MTSRLLERIAGLPPGKRALLARRLESLLSGSEAAEDKQLVAYVVPRPGAGEETLKILEEGLRDKLPPYMIPAAFVSLDRLPRTPNGKIDRRLLAEMQPERPAVAGKGFVAPRNETEQALADVWSEVLGIEQIAADDHFFALGGHSLLVAKLLSRIRQRLGVELPLRSVFEAPVLADLAERITSRRTAEPQAPPLVRTPRTEPPPLSFAQKRLWFLDRLDPGSSAYNIPDALRVAGRLRPNVWDLALSEIVRRHEALRTTFAWSGSEPVQVIGAPEPVDSTRVDLRSLAPGEREVEARRLRLEEAQAPFNLERGPLLRSTLVQLADEDWLLLLTMHHIVSDGWSTGVLIHEMRELYPAFAAGRPSPLPELPIQYADFAAWQRGWLRGEILEQEIAHWRGVLSDAPPALDLPTDHPRPAAQSFRGGRERLEINTGIARSLADLAAREGVTLFMTVLAAFEILLARYTHARDFCVGSPISGRNRIEIEGLVGFFVNTLVLRSDLSGEPDVRDLLGRVRARVLDAYSHQDVPFELLVDDLAPQRDLSRSPLFQILLLVQNSPLPELRLPGASLVALPLESRTAKFDLTLTVEETDRGLWAGLEYAADLFEVTTARRMLRHFGVLLDAIVSDPRRPVWSLPILLPGERQQILVEWNDAELGRRKPGWVHELFEAQVRRTPEATALAWRGLRLTYIELNRKANRLAHHLRRLGIGPESRVGVSLERGPEMIVSLLATLKAGGAYVPLDPSYPAPRLAWILEDAGIEVLLTRTPFLERLPGFTGWAFRFEADSHLLAAEPEVDPAGWRFDRQLAYVLYTSGSTGRPKGVLIEHRNAVALLDWASSLFAPEELAGVLAATSINFDLSIFEMFLPLICGGTVILAENALELTDLATAGEVTLVNTVPSAAAELIRSGGLPPSVRTVNLAGEPLPRTLVEDLYRIPSIRKVYNLYGPTEDTTYSTWALLGPGETAAPSIGRPIAGSQLYLVDPGFQPVPLGSAGEIVLGGSGLTRGYLGRPDLTAERFLPNPFAAEPGERLYHTGDLGKLLPDGRVAFLGRIDHQVKIRGFRIELGEIEAVLREHTQVEDVVVIARESAGGPRLLAYVVLEGSRPASSEVEERLRQHVAERLPAHMIPSALVLLKELPRTPNGKVDRRALPDPGMTAREAYVAPKTPMEELIASVWAEVLDLPRVGAEDNFFELGGHSLLATRVMVRLRDAFGLDLPLRRLFETPTVAGLARQAGAAGTIEEQAPPLRPRGTAEPRLSFAQERLWFLEQLQPEAAAYNLPVALRLDGSPRVGALSGALSEIVRRHESLRTTLEVRGGEPVQVIHPAAPLLLPIVDLAALPSQLRSEAAQRLALEESLRPFDLAAGPVIRASLLRLGPEEHVLLVTLHHVVSDGWSMGLLIREASTLYKALLEGRPSPLPELAVQYADFSVWQREWLRGEVLESQLAWWREHLKGAPGVLDLPADRPRPAVRSTRGGRVLVEIPPEVARNLAALGRTRGATPFMLYLATFQILLGRLAGREDLVVGMPIAGRVRAELEPLIGLFLNTLALRGDLSGDPTFGEHLARVREAALGAYAHQELPFERLVDELAPERNLTHAPVFQVLFVFQNVPLGTLELPGLTWSPLQNASGMAKFDLTLTLQEEGEGLAGQLGFNRDLFDEATVRRWAGYLGVLLEGVVREPEKRLSERELMSAAERHQVLRAWNDTARGVVEETLHGLFVAQARRTPETAALRYEGEEMSFGELDRRSNQLARFLRSHGVGPDVLVGLCMERSLELVVGVLGILKAGGGYVPLDPGYPVERLAYMLEDSGAPILLGQERLLDRMPGSGTMRVLVDSDWERIAAYGAEPLPELAAPDHLACVLYTSGSTGRPKGVLDSHRCVINQLRWLQSTYCLDGTDRVLQKTPISWDVSLWELFWPLSSGACMVLAQPGGHQDPRYLATTIAGERITTVHFVPSMLRIFLESESGESCSSLRRVVSSGEALGLDLEERFFASFSVDLNNMYGPGESARTTLWRCERGNTRAVAPIGRPTHDTQVYVLDGRMEPVPIGVTGELWVASQSMARGYHLRPGLTAEKFLPNPFGTPGTRLYRTGDLGRTLSDGTLEFLGRIDHQVKIRGVRIELGEIETALGQHPKVSDAVVVARSVGSGEKRLAAYVVPEAGPEPVSAEELRDHLRSELPDYMVPESWVMLESLPLAPNGKADRDRLPEPQWVTWQRDYAPPRTPVEELLATVWSELLGVERVGARDSFFELGGNSLLATQVASRVRSVFGVEMPLRTVFERPELAELASVVAELLRRGPGPAAPPLLPVPRTGPLPLSFAQQRLWFLERFEPGSSAYNIPNALRVNGALRPEVWDGVLSEIVRRHESLRTTFAWRDGEPVQVIGPPGPVTSAMNDLRSLEPRAREAEAHRLAVEEARRPFDLERGPLLRSRLLRLTGGEWLLLLTVHHIASDGWSTGVLIRELRDLYGAMLEGRPSPLPELAVQYADFSVWQREWLRGEVLESQLAWWREHLKGAPGVLDLPADRPRPAVRSTRGGRVLVEIPPEVARNLAALGHTRGATPFMLYLTTFQILLGRLAGREDLVVGMPIAGRVRAELEPLIGLFLNTLALRGDLSGDPTFGEHLARVREAALGAYAHQELPFERLVDELAPERNLTHAPVFQVLFVFQNVPLGTLELPGLTWSPLQNASGMAKFDLTLTLQEEGEGLAGQLGFNRDLFDEATVRRWAGYLGVLLEGVVREPEKRLSERELMSAAERHQVLRAWNDTARGVVEETLHGLFVAQARRTPETAALRYEGEEMSFGELDRRSNQLARFLRSHGVGPDVLVGLCMERSLELVVGVLGILKAGGGYVPLDPGYPVERLAYMLEDSRAPVLLGQERLLDRMPESGAMRVLVDADWERIKAYGAEPLPELADPDHLACVLYTSGSTGRPKGVMDSHRCVINQLRWLQLTYRLDGTDRVLQKTPISWDVSLWELFWPLSSGGCMVLAQPGGHQDPRYLATTIAVERITTVHFVPSMLRIFLESESGESCSSLRRVVSSGEALGLDLEERFFASFSVDLNNMYGPGESARTTLWRCERGNTRAVAPIGRPTHDTQVYVLDGRMEPVPIGVTGELWVASQSMARGYHLRPGLTAEKFLPNPFGAPGTRLYRTGDLGRTLPDGTLEFLGRIDHQVKIRGVRIELGEIETALGQHPRVSDAVVVARSVGSGEKRLAAYVVPEAGPEPVSAEELRDHLRSELPDYMVPESWVMLESLPLAPNGKADRDRLPEPQWVTWQRDYAAPRTPVEELLATVWSELLGVERVGMRDSFFELGGNSLLATQVASRVRSMFGVEMPLRTVFERPELAELASVVAELLRRGHGLAAPPLLPVPRTGPLPLSFAQQRLWFLERFEPGSSAYNVSLPLRLRGGLDVQALGRALSELVRRQESLRTVFEVHDQQVRQRITEPVPVPLPLIDLGALPADRLEEEAECLARAETARSFDLVRGPVLRTLLVRLSESDHVFVLSQHHIVSDGWSTGIFIREMAALYQAFAQGEPSPLPELPLQYADFAVWQRNWLSGSGLEEELRWWREHLQGAPALLELPLDRPRPPMQTFSGGQVRRELPAPLTARLIELAKREGATAFMTFLALLEALLLRHTGQSDFVLGTPIANRNRTEVEGLIGFFVNTLALRSDLTGSPSFRVLLARVRETTIGAFTHQDLPFEKLVEELQPERSLSHTPLFQVMFSLAAPAEPPSLPGLAFEALPLESGTAKFDLTLLVEDRAGRFALVASYNSDLFLAATMQRLLEHFEVLLEGAVADPERPVKVLPLMSAAESHQVVQGWNATAAPFPESSCLHELFVEQARRSPDAIALEYGEERLNYAELYQRAGVLARRLRLLGVGVDSLVGISTERSIEMVVGLLGILQAGGAYVPLDPSYPAERLAYMLEDSGIGVLLTQSWLEAGLPALPGKVLRLDDPGLFAGPADGELDFAATPSSLAYSIYTSGSTGRPKGAGVTHRGIVNRLCWMQSAYRLTAEDRVLQKTPFSFDVSVWEFFWPLITGAQLVMAPPEAHQDPVRLAGLIQRHRITTLHFVPSMLQVFLEQKGLAESCRSVRQVFASGEALPFELKERFLSRLPGTALHNLYGPTEAAVDVTFHACEPGGERRIVPIGRPIDNTEVLLLDSEGQPVPIGVPGELHIGGVNLARGYLGRPELTAERFIPDGFGGQPGARLYRTGDLARFRPDGEVEFLGRLDHQVKIHGVRIELGEIEAALGRHLAIRESVVMARRDEGSVRLVAYLVPGGESGGSALEGADLRAFLRGHLPEAMIPSAFVILPAFPLNPSGKVDRKALPAPQWSERQAAFVAPRTSTEQALAGLWAELLHMPRIGVEDSFFDLGGTSLQAALLVISLESRLGEIIPLAVLFEAPTVAGLARYLEERFPAAVDRLAATSGAEAFEGLPSAVQGEDSPLVAIQPRGSQPPLFCVHPVGGTVFCYLPLARALGPDQPVYGLQSMGFASGREPVPHIEEMAEIYVKALRSVQPRGPYRLAGWSMGGAVAYEMARLLTAAGEEVAALVLLDSSVPQGTQDLEEWDVLGAFAADLAGLTAKRFDVELAALREMAPERRVPFFLEHARAVGALPADLEGQQLDRLLKVFRVNLKALHAWAPLPSPQAEVVLVRPEEKLAQTAGDGGWGRLSGGEVRIWPVQGDHYSLLREPEVSSLARRLSHYFKDVPE